MSIFNKIPKQSSTLSTGRRHVTEATQREAKTRRLKAQLAKWKIIKYLYDNKNVHPRHTSMK
jgi:hypothetical protein